MASPRRQQQRFTPLDERFTFIGDGVSTGPRDALRPVLFEVEERAGGGEFCLKLWRKTGTGADAELRKLWRHELRHVQRIMSHNGAHGVIVDVVEFVEDAADFGVLMDRAGHPLAALLARVNRSHWLNALATAANRARLWRNVRRLVEALGIVHAQGLVHGRIGEDVIFTDGSGEPDFRLAGFEWSLWLDGDRRQPVTPARTAPAASRKDLTLSFAGDWQALGEMVCRLLGVTFDSAGNLAPGAGREMPRLCAQEVRWLKRVVLPRPRDALEAQSLLRSIDEIIVEVAKSIGQRDGRCTLLVPRATTIGATVYDASGGAIAADDIAGQLAWLRADLDAEATLCVPPGSDDAGNRMLLVTARMVYHLRPFHDDGAATWDVAVAHRVEGRRAALSAMNGSRSLALDISIDLVGTERETRALRNAVGRSALDWQSLAGPEAAKATDRRLLVRSALHLVEVAGAVVKSLDILPVEILRERTRQGQVVLRSQSDSERDKLAQQLGLWDTTRTLQRLFEDEGRDSGVRWRLSSSSRLGTSRVKDVGASYVGSEDVAGIAGLCFDLDGPVPEAEALYLRPDQDIGTEQQIKRRQRNIEALDTRLDLLDMLADPWRGRRSSRQTIDTAIFEHLDAPKRDAIAALWSTAPAFWVVGPPGVGKTTLATAVVHAIFRTDPAARVLVCAQGHDALDNLEQKIAALRGRELDQDLVIVRSIADDRDGPRRLDRVAAETLEAFLASELVQNAPAGLRRHVEQLAARGQGNDERQSGVLSSLVLEAANIVVSTLNSGDIERMVANREPFDWVIVEEAAKATGPELAGALALGSRRLLIGDHRQLPPFDADRLGVVFADSELVRKIVGEASDIVGPLFGDAVLDELTRIMADTADSAELMLLARRQIEPFRAVVEEDERLQGINPHHRHLSATLSEQRRMDPAIAHLVSSTFYGGILTTATERAEKAHQGATAVVACTDGLPASPIVVVDFPHVSRTGRREPAERSAPQWHNPAEIDSVIDVLRRLRAPQGGDKPTLAVLSPYAAQVRKIEERLASERDRSLRHLDGFAPARDGLGLVGTVDSFQGSEADVVVVSLVRNNPRVGLGAVGFLRERRRLNVMLSRAKHKLVLVGSLSFLVEAARGVNPGGGEHGLAFLDRMVEAIHDLALEERCPGLPLTSIIGPETLRRRP